VEPRITEGFDSWDLVVAHAEATPPPFSQDHPQPSIPGTCQHGGIRELESSNNSDVMILPTKTDRSKLINNDIIELRLFRSAKTSTIQNIVRLPEPLTTDSTSRMGCRQIDEDLDTPLTFERFNSGNR